MTPGHHHLPPSKEARGRRPDSRPVCKDLRAAYNFSLVDQPCGTVFDMRAAHNDASNDRAKMYEKHSLDINSTRSMRILPPESTDGSDIISCRLGVVSLDESPKYRALSYVWGDPSVTKPILVDDTTVQVRMNLWTFLDQMRNEQYWDALWIDALCINEDDLEERSEQVSIMGPIYTKATGVRAWLGPGTEIYVLAMHGLADTEWPKNDQIQDDQVREDEVITFFEQPLATDEFFAPIIDLLNNEYWSRIWIVQEYCLAADLVVQCGTIIVPSVILDCLYRMAYHVGLQPKSKKFERIWKNVTKAKLLSDSMGDLGVSPGSSVISMRSTDTRHFPHRADAGDTGRLFGVLQDSKCTDPRDFVYALLSLSAFLSAEIVSDYTKPVLQLFLNVTDMFKVAEIESWEWENIFDAVNALREGLQLDHECAEVQEVLEYFHKAVSDHAND